MNTQFLVQNEKFGEKLYNHQEGNSHEFWHIVVRIWIHKYSDFINVLVAEREGKSKQRRG